jgi:hypothetical protein
LVRSAPLPREDSEPVQGLPVQGLPVQELPVQELPVPALERQVER